MQTKAMKQVTRPPTPAILTPKETQMPKPRTLSMARSRTELIAEFKYGQPYWMLISQEERDKAASSGAAMDDGSYPITTCSGDNSVDTAIHAVGRGGADHDPIRKHIITRAKSLGCSSKIPDNWNADGSLADDGSASAQGTAFADPLDPTPPSETDPPTPMEADAEVTQGIASIKAAVASTVEAQGKDPDTTDPVDQKVTELLQQITSLVDEVEATQKTDTDTTGKAPDAQPETPDKPTVPPVKPAPPAATSHLAAPAPSPAPPGEAVTPTTAPVDEDGNINDGHPCANPDCQHLASAHADTDAGKNTGPCSMNGCECPAMQVDSGQDQDDSSGVDSTTGGPDNAGGDADPANTIGDQTSHARRGALATGPVGGTPEDAPSSPPPGDATPSDDAAPAPEMNAPPQLPGGDSMGPAFTIPVGVIEGQPTGDGREIAPGALDWRLPPMPLMGLATSTHDPSGFDMNDPAVLCGRIDSLSRVPGQGETQVIMAQGFFLSNDDGMYFADLVEGMGRCGISADIAVEEQEITGALDEDGWPMDESTTLTKGTIMGFTLCPFPAFEGAYVVLGDGTDKPEAQAIPQTAETPPTADKPPAAVTAGGQLIHFVTYEECESCAQGIDLIVASGGPAKPPKGWFENPNFTDGDGRLVEILEKRGTRALGGKYACPPTVEGDRVFGHVAPFGVCHTGISGQCLMAPRSRLDYAPFKVGNVMTAEGEMIRTGVLTVGTGHASTSDRLSAANVMAHYDNTGTAVADVNVGEDEYGIWFAGAIRPGATEAQVEALRRSTISPDWRTVGGHLEMVAGLAVNQPGFPLAMVASGRVESLVAVGSGVMHKLKNPVDPSTEAVMNVDVALRAALAPELQRAKSHARERLFGAAKKQARERLSKLVS
jgi:hypothetical protein